MASQASLQLVVSLKDEASKPIAGVAKNVSALGTAVGVFAGGAALAGIRAVSGAVTDFLGDAITESRDAAKGLAQTQAVIQSTGGAAGVTADQIVEMAGALSHTTLFTDDAIQAQENLLLTFTNVKNVAGEGNDIFTQSSKIALDLAQAMGTDAAGGAIQLGKALNDPVAGISALTRVGVTFTDQQKEQIKTLEDSGNILGAQKIILAELTKEFGGSAAAAAAADGGFHNFQQTMADMKQTIGDALQPALKSLADLLNSPAITAGLSSLASGIASSITSAIAWINTTGIPALQQAWQGIKDTIAGFTTGDFSNLKIDLTGIFGPDGATFITDTLQRMREGFGLLRDSVVTFQQAWAGDWKNADSILPLHQAIGNFGLQARGVFDDITNRQLPALVAEFQTAMPENQRLINNFLAFLNGTYFPQYNAGMNAAQLQTQQYGIVIGDTTKQGQQSYADMAKGVEKSLNDMQTLMNTSGIAMHTLFLQIAQWAQDLITSFQGTVQLWANASLAISEAMIYGMARAEAFVQGAVGNIIGFIIHAIERIQDLISWIGRVNALHVQTPAIPGGGGGGSGFGGGSGGGGGGSTPQGFSDSGSTNNTIHLNFYGSADGDSVVQGLRSVGLA